MGRHKNKHTRLKYLAVRKDKTKVLHLPLEFEGNRAFAVWDSVALGKLLLKARIELNPRLLRKPGGSNAPFEYTGKLVLPAPETN